MIYAVFFLFNNLHEARVYKLPSNLFEFLQALDKISKCNLDFRRSAAITSNFKTAVSLRRNPDYINFSFIRLTTLDLMQEYLQFSIFDSCIYFASEVIEIAFKKDTEIEIRQLKKSTRKISETRTIVDYEKLKEVDLATVETRDIEEETLERFRYLKEEIYKILE